MDIRICGDTYNVRHTQEFKAFPGFRYHLCDAGENDTYLVFPDNMIPPERVQQIASTFNLSSIRFGAPGFYVVWIVGRNDLAIRGALDTIKA